MRRKTGVEIRAGHHDAETIGPDQPHAIFPRGAFGGFRQRARAVAEPGGDDERARRAPRARLLDQPGNGGRRRGNHHEFGRKRQFADAADGGNAVDLGIMRIHQAEFALEFRLANIAEDGPADRSLARAGPDQRDRTGRKQIFQMIGRHQFSFPAGAGLGVTDLTRLCACARLVRKSPTQHLVRHHNPAGWPPYDGFGHPAPYDFVQPRVAIGAHDQKINCFCGSHRLRTPFRPNCRRSSPSRRRR